MTILKVLTAAAIVTTLTASSAYAQAQRLAGEIKRVDGNIIFADGRDGNVVFTLTCSTQQSEAN